VNGLVLLGPDPRSLITQFNEGARGRLNAASVDSDKVDEGEVIVWLLGGGGGPKKVMLAADRRRGC